jgi:hypothetical protein
MGCQTQASSQGGALWLSSVNLTVVQSTFADNAALVLEGGAIFSEAIPVPGYLKVSSATFSNNSVSSQRPAQQLL